MQQWPEIYVQVTGCNTERQSFIGKSLIVTLWEMHAQQLKFSEKILVIFFRTPTQIICAKNALTQIICSKKKNASTQIIWAKKTLWHKLFAPKNAFTQIICAKKRFDTNYLLQKMLRHKLFAPKSHDTNYLCQEHFDTNYFAVFFFIICYFHKLNFKFL